MKEIFIIECPIRNEPVALSKEPFGLIPHWLKRKKSFDTWETSLKLKKLKPKVSILDRANDDDFDLQFEMYLDLFQSWNLRLFNHLKDPKPKIFDYNKIKEHKKNNLGLIDGIGRTSLNLKGIYLKIYDEMNLDERELYLELMAFYELRCLGLVRPDPKSLSSCTIVEVQHNPEVKVAQSLIEQRLAENSTKLFIKIPKISLVEVISYLNHLFWINATPIILNEEIWTRIDNIYNSIKSSNHCTTLEEEQLFKKYLSAEHRSKALLVLNENIEKTLSLFKDSNRIDIEPLTAYAFNIVRRNDYRYFLSTRDEETQKKSINYTMSFFQFCRTNSLTSLPLSEEYLKKYIKECFNESQKSIGNFCFHIYTIQSIHERFGLQLSQEIFSSIKKFFSCLNQIASKRIYDIIIKINNQTVDELRDKCILTWALNKTDEPIDKYLLGSIFKTQVDILKTGNILVKEFRNGKNLLIRKNKDIKICPVKSYLDYEKFIPKKSPIFSHFTTEENNIHTKTPTSTSLNPREIESIIDCRLDEQLTPNLDFLHIKIDEDSNFEKLPYYHMISREIAARTYNQLRTSEPNVVHLFGC